MRFSLPPLPLAPLVFLLSACGGAVAPNAPYVQAEWGVTQIVTNDTNVYWLSGGSVYSCPLAGCEGQPRVVAWSDTGIQRFAIDATSVYIAGSSNNQTNYPPNPPQGTVTIARCPLAGCGQSAASTIYQAVDDGEITALAVDASNVYWADETSLNECSLSGCSAGATTLVWLTQGAGEIVSDAKSVYWSDTQGGRIASCAISGCNQAPTTLASGQDSATALALDGASLYWVEGGPVQGGDDGAIVTCAIASCTSTLTVLAANQAWPYGLAVSGGAVYWSDVGQGNEGVIMECATTGCDGAPKTLADAGSPTWLAVGGGNVYWTTSAQTAIYEAPVAP